MHFNIDLIPPHIIAHYELQGIIHKGCTYTRIKRAWYGLKQSKKIAHDNIVEHLNKYGYEQTAQTEGLFKHHTRDIAFTLMVDDFGIEYTNQANVGHLINAVQDKCLFKVDWEAKQYIGFHLNWDYDKHELCTSMEGHVEQALKEFKHSTPKQRYKGPSHIKRPKFGEPVQYVKLDTSPTLTLEHIKFIQRVTGKILIPCQSH